METLAFLYSAVDYEDPNLSLELRSFDDLKFQVPASVIMGAAAVGVMAVTTLGSARNAQALMAKGDRGPGVAQLQATLGIPADGVYGPVTKSAVYSYQVKQGLLRDGIVGPATLSALGLPTGLSSGGGTGGGGSSGSVSSSAHVVASALIIRSAPAGADTGGTLYRGDVVSLTGARSYSGGRSWVKLSRGGWVAEDYLSYGGGGSGNVSAGAHVTASALIVRDAPAGADTGATLYSGDRVSLTGARKYAGGRYWLQLASGNWVAESYIGY